MMDTTVHFVCRGCGFIMSPHEARPFSCPRRDEVPGIEHVLERSARLHADSLRPLFEFDEHNPFVLYRPALYSFKTAHDNGIDDEELFEMVLELDRAVEQVDGTGFEITPFTELSSLAAAIGLPSECALWAKDETQNVSGSHKARHLMGVQLWLESTYRLGWAKKGAPLAIASCGNAALAAAVIARAANETLRVFVPENAEPSILSRLEELGAEVHLCPRKPGQVGDPCMHAFAAQVNAGAVPYACQGTENAMAIEGGLTLGYEIANQLYDRGDVLHHLAIQVGGGALGMSIINGLRSTVGCGLLEGMPRIHCVQTFGAHPLHRAWFNAVNHLFGTSQPYDVDIEHDLTRAEKALEYSPDAITSTLEYAAANRSEFMWPWEAAPQSVADGILDDETYDWLGLVEAMIRMGGIPLVVAEPTLIEAHRLTTDHTGASISPTGSSGVAGVMELVRAGAITPGERIGVILSGQAR